MSSFRYARAYVKYVINSYLDFLKGKRKLSLPSSLLSEEGSKCMEASVPDACPALQVARGRTLSEIDAINK